LATLALRDRDAIITKEGLIFRVLGYTHPPDAYICDLEYAPASVFKSSDPKAPRGHPQTSHYKFYEDEGWTYLAKHNPQYLIPHTIIQKRVIGVNDYDIAEVRRPQEKLRELLARPEKDELLTATQNVLDLVTERSGLHVEDFGVFGSMLHGFHHPKLSDIDLTVYGIEKTTKLRGTLRELYADVSSPLRNEFETDRAIRDKRWRFRNLSPEEYVWHQWRKTIYALFKDKRNGRTIKTEFEPVKDSKKISSEYDSETRILPRGWVKMTARVTEGSEAPFIPSIYGITPIDVIEGPEQAAEASWILSYMEEFRLQVNRNEEIYVEGNVEEVKTPSRSFFQVVLTYCSRYYEQVLKCRNLPWCILEGNG
jgi:predicted nucleotidyltransferase